MRSLTALLTLSIATSLGGCEDRTDGSAAAPHTRITAVGSSTVYPFTAMIAERFADAFPDAPPPVIESTGTGAGMRLFCSGSGVDRPDIADASRRMRRAEYAHCREGGAGAVVEVPIGIDGIVFAAAAGAPRMTLSAADLYRALAAAPGGRPNRARTWHDVDPALPAVPIQVYGPPATSGTRDALVELILARGCAMVDPGIRTPALAARQPRCTRIREDGAFADAGENDNFIVRKLAGNPGAIGVFGYSYLAENAATVRGIPIDGVRPTDRAIADGRYPGARLLYLYVRKARLDTLPGLRAFLRLYAASWAPDGPLVRRGLIAAPADVRTMAAQVVAHATPLDPATLPE